MKMQNNVFGKSHRGFTLIELLIVIAIIGILAGVVVLNLSDQTGDAQLKTLRLNIAALRAPAQIEQLKDGTNANICGEVNTASPNITVDAITGATLSETSVQSSTGPTDIKCWHNKDNWMIWAREKSGTTTADARYTCTDHLGNLSKTVESDDFDTTDCVD